RRDGCTWRVLARAPTDPDVLAFGHPVPQPTDSPPHRGPEAIPPSCGDLGPSLDGLDLVPLAGSASRRVASLPGVLRARPPASTVLSQRYDFRPPLPPHFVTFLARRRR